MNFEVFGGVFFFVMLSRSFLDFSVGVGAFVIGLSQIVSFFSLTSIKRLWSLWTHRIFPLNFSRKLHVDTLYALDLCI